MRRALVDVNVFVYALGEPHRYREPCRSVVADLAGRRIAGETSVEVLQELVHVRSRRHGSADATSRVRDILAWELPIHGFGIDDLGRALGLIDRHQALPGRDAVHAATALNRGIDSIISTDTDFDQVEGITRIDPSDESEVAKLRVGSA